MRRLTYFRYTGCQVIASPKQAPEICITMYETNINGILFRITQFPMTPVTGYPNNCFRLHALGQTSEFNGQLNPTTDKIVVEYILRQKLNEFFV